MILNFALLLQFLLQEKSLKILELNVNPKQLKVDIKAGTDGFWGWLMRLLGIDTKSGYSVDLSGCRRTAHGLASVSRTFAPLYNLSTTVYFLVKPIWALFLGIIFSFTTLGWLWGALTDRQGPSIVSLFFVAIFGMIAFALIWKFFMGERTAVIGAMTNGGAIISIKLKVPAHEFSTLQQAIAIIETLVSRANGTTGSSPGFAGAATPNVDDALEEEVDDLEDADDDPKPMVQPRQAADEKRVIQCPHCDAKLRLNATILGNRIRCPACQEPFVAK